LRGRRVDQHHPQLDAQPPGRRILIAIGQQSKINWKSVAITAISAGLAPPGTGNILADMVTSAAANAATQGIWCTAMGSPHSHPRHGSFLGKPKGESGRRPLVARGSKKFRLPETTTSGCRPARVLLARLRAGIRSGIVGKPDMHRREIEKERRCRAGSPGSCVRAKVERGSPSFRSGVTAAGRSQLELIAGPIELEAYAWRKVSGS
jgi:hypothetical protein